MRDPLINVASVALRQKPRRWRDNLANMVEATTLAKAQRVDLLVMDELCISGYSCRDYFLRPETIQTAWEMLMEYLPHTKGIAAVVGLPVRFNNAVYNCACFIVDGKIQGFIPKQNLANNGIFEESRWFKAWKAGKVAFLPKKDGGYPIGDLVFEWNGLRIGFEICEDAWAAERPAGKLAERGVDLIVNISASPFAIGKQRLRRELLTTASAACCIGYVYSNLVGNDEGRVVFDGSCLIASGGRILAEGKRFSYHRVSITTAVIDTGVNRAARSQLASHNPLLDHDPGLIQCDTSLAFKLEQCAVFQPELTYEAWEMSPDLRFEEYVRAAAMAVWDYMLDSRHRGLLVSLSGGADSSMVAALGHFAIRFALESLGADISAQLSYIPGAAEAGTDLKKLAALLLNTIYQGTENSSQATRQSAREVAGELGASHMEVEVDELIAVHEKIVSGALNVKLTWEEHDLPKQNMQPRGRGWVVMTISNIKGWLLLNTGNRSEGAVGYCTMYGDTCGGLNPIGGISKHFLLQCLRWLEAQGPNGWKLSSLHRVNSLKPSAELRPLSANQTDEADLMPYYLLEMIEEWGIGEKRHPDAVYELALQMFVPLGYSQLQILEAVIKYFRMFPQSQWKREQLPPGVHVDSRNLDKTSWCRLPINSGGFDYELRGLRKRLEELKSEAANV